jgi:hypothetical protein
MVYYGQGFTMIEVYNMPTYLRNFYYNKLADAKKKESENVKNSQTQKQPSRVRIKR